MGLNKKYSRVLSAVGLAVVGFLAYIVFIRKSDIMLWINLEKDLPYFPTSERYLKGLNFKNVPMKMYSDLKNQLPDGFDSKDNKLCKKLTFSNSTFEYSISEVPSFDIERLKKALESNQQYSQLVNDANENFKSKKSFARQWSTLGFTSIWMPSHGFHYAVRTLCYSPIDRGCYATFLFHQAFDRDWNEVEDFSISPHPDGSANVADKVDIPDTQVPNVDETKNGEKRNYEIRSEISTTGPDEPIRVPLNPRFLSIPFDYELESERFQSYGPSDVVLLSRWNVLGFDEPIISFGLREMSRGFQPSTERQLYLPFTNELKELRDSSGWAKWENLPFMSHSTNKEGSEVSKLKFIHSHMPLTIITCDIDSGLCDHVQTGNGELRDRVEQFVELPLPSSIPQHIKDKFNVPPNRSIYLGLHSHYFESCYCYERRPQEIYLLIEDSLTASEYQYSIVDISKFVIFTPHADEESIDKCERGFRGLHLSLAFWDLHSIQSGTTKYYPETFDRIPDDKIIQKAVNEVTNKHGHSHKEIKEDGLVLNDVMGIFVYDKSLSLVHFTGLMDFILNLGQLDAKQIDKNRSKRLNFVETCLDEERTEFCSGRL
ncbi:uncharacterized protein RJT20DRAFT_48642 [Scheffersomyces xylosifermentans]|uniref:uncharacterized protein n=1 Tax=Scheffersomyces xylosifermentans TaxID=1304137 RepID=UPI00315D4CF3